MSGNGQDEQEGFLARWSRRKTQSLRGEVPPEPADDADADVDLTGSQSARVAEDAPAVAEEVPPAPAEEPAAAAELPPLESLGADSDYSAFMGEGVPADLRRQALKKLFHSPKFNVRDGLDDYDWDFSNPEPLGDIVTAEMRYRIKRELERLAGLDDDAEIPEDQPAVAAADAAQHDEAHEQPDPEADDERSEPS